MSRILYIYNRYHELNKRIEIEKRLCELCEELIPDNVDPFYGNKVFTMGKTACAVTLSNTALYESGPNFLVGYVYGKEKSWKTPKSGYPDGNYAIFRQDKNYIELVSDSSASRTIWYYHDSELFIASTSQRAIILFLGKFVFDDRVIPWMLSTGSLGPELSWDKRIKRVNADSSVLLDKNSWALSVNQNSAVFSEINRSRKDHKELLVDTIRNTIKSLDGIDFSQWVLPLSGGYDSRAILCLIKEQFGSLEGLRTVTWGLEKSLYEESNDARIAKQLAGLMGVPHKYYHTDISSENIDKIINRFLFCSEGRIDHISGYMDGMEIWRKFHEEGITGVIRGDEGFGGSVPVYSERATRLFVGCGLCTDFDNLKDILHKFDLPPQQLPVNLERRRKETLSTWRDRLYHIYRLPTIHAALSDIKLSYVEQINPLISRSILKTVRTLPDDLRTDKLLFREIVNSLSPDIPYAKKGANASPGDILKNRAITEILKAEINSHYANSIFGSGFLGHVSSGIKVRQTTSQPKIKNNNIKNGIGFILPGFVKSFIHDAILGKRIDENVLAFRVFIIIKMNKILNNDAARFN